MHILELTDSELNTLETLVSRAIGQGIMLDVNGAGADLKNISDKIIDS